MRKHLRKAVLFGMGVLSMTRDKIEEFVKELEKEGKITEKEGRKLVEDLLKDAKNKQKEIMNTLRKETKRIVDKSPLATKEDIKSLKKKPSPKKTVKKGTKPKSKKKKK